METSSFVLFSLALMVTAGTPGPSIAALVARVIARGWRDVVPFLAALWVGEVVWLTFAVLGISALAEQFHIGFVVLKYAGVIYLIYLAWKMWFAPVEGDIKKIPAKQSGAGMFAAGMALTLGNPKIMVFYVALLPSLIDLKEVDVQLWAILATIAVASIALTDIIWVALAERARVLLRTPAAIRMANRASALTLGGAAGLIAIK